MRTVDWIAVIGVVATVVLGLAGIVGVTWTASRQAAVTLQTAGRNERREAYLHLLAAKARVEQLITECRSARRARSEGETLSELQRNALTELIPAYRSFCDRVQIAMAFADPATAHTLEPLQRAMSRWVVASQDDAPEADRAEALGVQVWGAAFVRAVRDDLGVTALGDDADPAPAPRPPARGPESRPTQAFAEPADLPLQATRSDRHGRDRAAT